MASETRTPQVTWAQRKDRVLLTLSVQQLEKPTVRLDPASSHGRLFFAGEGGPVDDRRQYELNVELFGEIDADASKVWRQHGGLGNAVARRRRRLHVRPPRLVGLAKRQCTFSLARTPDTHATH